MKYRIQDSDGDYVFGRSNEFYVNNASAVAQAIRTRLLLLTGEWFLDTSEGTPYRDQILGYGTQGTRDLVIRNRILETPGVTQILEYTSDLSDRAFTVTATVETQYGTQATVSVTI